MLNDSQTTQKTNNNKKTFLKEVILELNLKEQVKFKCLAGGKDSKWGNPYWWQMRKSRAFSDLSVIVFMELTILNGHS